MEDHEALKAILKESIKDDINFWAKLLIKYQMEINSYEKRLATLKEEYEAVIEYGREHSW